MKFFIADKDLKIKKLQSNISEFEEEIRNFTYKLGKEAFDIYKKQGIPPQKNLKPLLKLGKKIRLLEEKINITKQEIERLSRVEEKKIKTEYPKSLYEHICPNCGIVLSKEANFCPDCGTKAEDQKIKIKKRQIKIRKV